MTIYLALLRGINVGGNKKIKMADLKHMLEEMGLSRVQTYIQSGNVMFESEEAAESLQTKIEQEIVKVFGFSVAVTLRTSAELKRVVEDCPYSADSLAEGESIHVTFLTEAPSPAALDKLAEEPYGTDEYHVTGRDIYLLLRQSVLDSKLPTKLQKLGTPATARNWNTVTKLAAKVQAMEV